MDALITCIIRWILAILTSVCCMQPVGWCDSCGEMYPASELSAEVDYGEHYHGQLCDICMDYWND